MRFSVLHIAVFGVSSLFVAGTCHAEPFVHVRSVGNGVFMVYDARENTRVHVKDPKAYIESKYGGLTGFGKGISPAKFQKPTSPVTDASKAAGQVTGAAVNTAAAVANRVPGWRKFMMPAAWLRNKARQAR